MGMLKQNRNMKTKEKQKFIMLKKMKKCRIILT